MVEQHNGYALDCKFNDDGSIPSSTYTLFRLDSSVGRAKD